MVNKIINLGILGCGNITPLSIIMPSKEITNLCIYGAASSSSKRAENYALKYNIPNVFGSYKDLIESDKIDCVYIALSNDLHADWSKNALKAGKHVLVEKPACLKSKEFTEIQKICIENKVHLLEAVMVQHHPWQNKIMEIINSGKYGKLLKTKTIVSFLFKNNFSSNYRTLPEKGGGVFYDLGTYWLQFAQCLGNINNAEYIGKSKFEGPNGCDWNFEAEINFENGVKSEFSASFLKPSNAFHKLELENAVITIPNFFIPYLGKRKMRIEIYKTVTGISNQVTFESQGYFVNQLEYFLKMINKPYDSILMDKTYERIVMMEKIYESAKKQTLLKTK